MAAGPSAPPSAPTGRAVFEQPRRRDLRMGHRRRAALRSAVPLRRAHARSQTCRRRRRSRSPRTVHGSQSASAGRGSRSIRSGRSASSSRRGRAPRRRSRRSPGHPTASARGRHPRQAGATLASRPRPRLLGRLLGLDAVQAIAFAPEESSSQPSIAGSDRTLGADSRSGAQSPECDGEPLELPRRRASVAFSPDGDTVAVGLDGRRVVVIDAATRRVEPRCTRRERRTWRSHSRPTGLSYWFLGRHGTALGRRDRRSRSARATLVSAGPSGASPSGSDSELFSTTGPRRRPRKALDDLTRPAVRLELPAHNRGAQAGNAAITPTAATSSSSMTTVAAPSGRSQSMPGNGTRARSPDAISPARSGRASSRTGATTRPAERGGSLAGSSASNVSDVPLADCERSAKVRPRPI